MWNNCNFTCFSFDLIRLTFKASISFFCWWDGIRSKLVLYLWVIVELISNFAIFLTFRWVARDLQVLASYDENLFYLAQVRWIFWYFTRFSRFALFLSEWCLWTKSENSISVPPFSIFLDTSTLELLWKKDTLRDAWICKKLNFI